MTTIIFKRVNTHLLDAFFGKEGWRQHARLEIGYDRSGKLLGVRKISGAGYPPNILAEKAVEFVQADDAAKKASLRDFNRELDKTRRLFRAPQKV